MHSCFLYHAINYGLDMAIVNAGQITIYEQIPTDLKKAIEDVLFNKLMKQALLIYLKDIPEILKEKNPNQWRKRQVEKVEYALVNGISELWERYRKFKKKYNSPVEIIEGPLMDGMNIVGDLFGPGNLFTSSCKIYKSNEAIMPTPFMEDGNKKKKEKEKFF